MPQLAGLSSAALLLFAATNLDDLLLLLVIASDRQRRYRPVAVLAGQLLGFSAILAISLLGFWSGLVAPERWMACLGLLPLGLGLRQQLALQAGSGGQDHEAATGFLGHPEQGTALPSAAAASTRHVVLKVAALTLANGSDNISVYLPLFGRLNLAQLFITVSIFYAALLGLWGVSQWLSHHQRLQHVVQAMGPRLSPLVLIALGLWLLKDSVLSPWST